MLGEGYGQFGETDAAAVGDQRALVTGEDPLLHARGFGRGGVDVPRPPVPVVQDGVGGVLDLDAVGARGHGGGDALGHAAQPLEQVQGVRGLVQQDAPALAVPSAAPRPGLVVRLGAVPG